MLASGLVTVVLRLSTTRDAGEQGLKAARLGQAVVT